MKVMSNAVKLLVNLKVFNNYYCAPHLCFHYIPGSVCGCHLMAGGFIVNLLCLPKLLACLQKKEELDSKHIGKK